MEDEVTPELKRRKLDIPDEDSGDEFVPGKFALFWT